MVTRRRARARPASTTSPTPPWASTPRPSPMGSTTWPTTRAGSTSATRPTPPSFAVESIRRWWNQMGRDRFPGAERLLITADAGGSNGYRLRAWKVELAKLAEETGLEITVCHYPPGTSKWNRIEHRMFSFITMNWRGRPSPPAHHHRVDLGHHHQDRTHHPGRLRPELVSDRASRSPTSSWPPSRSNPMSSTASGTTPSLLNQTRREP